MQNALTCECLNATTCCKILLCSHWPKQCFIYIF